MYEMTWDDTETWRQDQIEEQDRREEARYRRDIVADEQNTAWEDYQENWVEITEFVGARKPAASALQMGLPFDEVA